MKLLTPILILAAAVLINCSRSNIADSTGGGTETTNPKIVGKILIEGNQPAENVTVELIPENYDPTQGDKDEIITTTTDSLGNFFFEEFSAGKYNLLAATDDQSLITLKKNVVIELEGENDITISDIQLDSASKIEISVGNLDSGKVFIPGTNIEANIDSSTKEVMVITLAVPAGVYDEIIYLDISDSSKTDLVEDTVVVDPGDQKEILPYEYWPMKNKILLKVGDTGINADVYDFPLLVRLNSDDINFSQVQEMGTGFRITKADQKTDLCFDFELLDITKEEAVLWLKVDTVFANLSEQVFHLYYGYPYVEGVAGNCDVFDSANGYSTVYHFESLGENNSEKFVDASNRNNHGRTEGVSDTILQREYIGNGLNLMDSGQEVIYDLPHGFNGTSSFSLSMWIKFQVPEEYRMSVTHFGSHGELNGYHLFIRGDSMAQIGPFDIGGRSVVKPLDISDRQNWFNMTAWENQWTYLTFVYDVEHGNISTYLNDSFIVSDTTSQWDIDGNVPGYIGRKVSLATPPEIGYEGEIDEIRFINKVVGENRRRLNYHTQKVGSGVVIIE